jgi:Carboxypeptidase regulatory-like domain
MIVSMARRRLKGYLCLVCVLACLAIPRCAMASESHGQVTLNGLPLPGATVTATQGDKKFVTASDDQGLYSFADLPDGTWSIKVEMTGFTVMEQQVSVAPNAPAVPWELKMLPVDAMIAQTKIVKAEPVQEALPQAPSPSTAPAKKAAATTTDNSAAPKPEE